MEACRKHTRSLKSCWLRYVAFGLIGCVKLPTSPLSDASVGIGCEKRMGSGTALATHPNVRRSISRNWGIIIWSKRRAWKPKAGVRISAVDLCLKLQHSTLFASDWQSRGPVGTETP